MPKDVLVVEVGGLGDLGSLRILVVFLGLDGGVGAGDRFEVLAALVLQGELAPLARADGVGGQGGAEHQQQDPEPHPGDVEPSHGSSCARPSVEERCVVLKDAQA